MYPLERRQRKPKHFGCHHFGAEGPKADRLASIIHGVQKASIRGTCEIGTTILNVNLRPLGGLEQWLRRFILQF